jgi:hypothetical protein
MNSLWRYAALLMICVGNLCATVLTFDDIGGPTNLGLYGGLFWDNGGTVDKNTVFSGGGGSGYVNGTVSGDYTGINKFGDPLTVVGNSFDFVGTYLTAAWRNDLHVSLKGYNGASLLYDQTVIVDSDGPTWFNFNYAQITSLVITTSGGTPAGWENIGRQVAMDNFTVQVLNPLTSVPPGYTLPPGPSVPDSGYSAILLMGALGLLSAMHWRRVARAG